MYCTWSIGQVYVLTVGSTHVFWHAGGMWSGSGESQQRSSNHSCGQKTFIRVVTFLKFIVEFFLLYSSLNLISSLKPCRVNTIYILKRLSKPHIIVKLAKIKHKGKILKDSKQKWHHLKAKIIPKVSDFSSKL